MAEECIYYYYDRGYSCALKREKEGNSSIDSDIVHRYCWGYHYNDCPMYRSRGGSSGGCFLTSACVEAKGLADDCQELTVLRRFRESYLRSIPEGQREIAEYYIVAPKIVAEIKKRADAIAIFDSIYEKLVKPCVDMIERGENEDAHKLYRETVKQLQTEYL